MTGHVHRWVLSLPEEADDLETGRCACGAVRSFAPTIGLGTGKKAAVLVGWRDHPGRS